MPQYDLSKSTTTDFTNVVPDFIVNQKVLDNASKNQDETYWYFDKAPTNFGYYFAIPEIYSAANALATWSVGKGWKVQDESTRVILNHIRGMGQDSFNKIMWNHQVTKVVVGDAFLEVKKVKKVIVNMIPISPERVRLVFNKEGLIKRYDVWNGSKWKVIQKENMIHSSNKRIGDSMHGQSQVEPAKFIIDFRNEMLADERIIKHRDKALGIAYYKTNNAGKISYTNSQIEKAVKNGEMLGLPEDTAKIEPYPSRGSEDRQGMITYCENFFYQVFGVPRSIATSDGTSEVGGINGHLIFEPIYGKEQLDLEDDLLIQQGITILFNRPPSLAPKTQENADKNTGQTSLQQGEVEPSLNR
tara:strand:+ start:2764 stop:3837 length:1074 start_codon:yes stop_codon:yes gene_type:complete